MDTRYCADPARDELGRFAGCNSGGGGGGSDSSGGGAVASAAVDAAKAGGGTLDPNTGTPLQPGQPGYVVAVPGHSGIFPDSQFFASDEQAVASVRSWMDANSEVLSQPGVSVGVWHDTANGEVVLDPSEVISDKSAAISAGIARDQQAIWDNGAMQEIPTGGTGGRAQAHPTSTRDLADALLQDDGAGEGRASPPPGGAGEGEGRGEPAGEVAWRTPDSLLRARSAYSLPAHRYLARKKDKPDEKHVVVFDFDETITKAPDMCAHLSSALRAAGDHVVVLTGNVSPRSDLLQRLADYGFQFDDLVQYEDDESDGIVRAEHLKQFGATFAVDNRIDRSPTYAKVCPHLFVVAEPPKPADKAAKGTKKVAKQAAKKIGLRMEARGVPRVPPNYRPMDTMLPGAKQLPAGSCCGGCDMDNMGQCWGYGNVRIEHDHVCDEFYPEQGQDAEQE